MRPARILRTTIDEYYFPRNRDISKAPKSGKMWCTGCDRKLVSPYGKCNLCGFRNWYKRFKKSC